MHSCYLGDHIAGGPIHTDITTCNIEESQQTYRLGTVLGGEREGGLNMFHWIKTLALCFCNGFKHMIRMKIS